MVSESEQIIEQRIVSSMLAEKGHTALGCGGEYFSSFSRILPHSLEIAKTIFAHAKEQREQQEAGDSVSDASGTAGEDTTRPHAT